MPERKDRSGAPQHITRRMRKIVEEQGHAAVMGIFAVVLIFICIPLFLVDDLLYVHTTQPEVSKRAVVTSGPNLRTRGESGLTRRYISNMTRFPTTDDIATASTPYNTSSSLPPQVTEAPVDDANRPSALEDDDAGVLPKDIPATDRNGEALWR